MDDLRKTMGEVRAHLQELDKSQAMTVKELDGMKGTVGGLVTTVGTLVTTVGTLVTTVGTLATTVGTLETNVQQLQKTTLRLDEGLDGLRRSVTLGHAATAALGGTFAGIEKILDQFATEGVSTRQELSDLKRRVEALERKAS